VEWEYSPVRIVERLGQQSEFTTNPFVNVIPLLASVVRTVGMCASSSKRWSSVRMRTMFGCTVNPVPLTASPSGFWTAIGPLVVPCGTTVLSSLLDITWNLAGVPLNVTDVVDLNAEPEIVTVDPTGPAERESWVIVGAAAWAMPGTTTRIIAVVVSTRVFLARLSAICGLLGRVGE
jgi:hypothetical protein